MHQTPAVELFPQRRNFGDLRSTSTGNGEDSANRPNLAGCRVLIIEDDGVQAAQLAEIVSQLGAQVAAIASSVQGALAEISRATFDVVTLDLNIDGMFSVGMARGLLEKHIPFVICTAYGHAASEFGPTPIVEKPITKEALAKAFRDVLSEQPQN
jgi:CheY-like chemotaxis protein